GRQADGQRDSSKVVSSPITTRMQAILQKDMVREFLAEFMSTYVMMHTGADMKLGSRREKIIQGLKLWPTEFGLYPRNGGKPVNV
uniref:Uncharacterized protein n=1 Tax=Canis lupus dingo TaxID=286419 RepID=A0A8C0KR67_CANLU